MLLCGLPLLNNKVILNIADALKLLKATNVVINSLCSSITTKFVNIKESYGTQRVSTHPICKSMGWIRSHPVDRNRFQVDIRKYISIYFALTTYTQTNISKVLHTISCDTIKCEPTTWILGKISMHHTHSLED